MKAYSMDLGERIVGALLEGASVGTVAERFGVSHDTVENYRKRQERGEDLGPLPRQGRTPRVSGEEAHEALRELVQRHPNATIREMSVLWQETSGQELPRSTLYDALRRVDARFKKNTPRQRTL